MTAGVAAPDPQIGARAIPINLAAAQIWVQSRPYDLLLLLLVPLSAVPVLLLAPAYPVVPFVVITVVGFAHYTSTFTFFAWDEYRERHRKRWKEFFLGPAAIAGTVLLLAPVRLVLPVVVFFWNIFHVVRQSGGLASVYRHRAGVTDVEDRRIANAAILSTSLWCSLYNIETHPQVFEVLTYFSASVPWVVKRLTFAAALVCLIRLALRLLARTRLQNGPRKPELLGLATGLTLFHPYLWVADSAQATGGMLLGHFVQYLSLVWLVHRRKFQVPTGSLAQRALGIVSGRTPLVLTAILVVGTGFLGGFLLSEALGLTLYFNVIYLMLALVHFYLDGLFWAFKDSTVRNSLGPYLTGFRISPLAA